jgi:hypothetical protein
MLEAHDDLLSLIKQSPAHVAAHDRQAWLDLFADDATVEDPVGSAAALKRDGTLAGFWDTFIAPHAIRFEVKADYVQGDDVLRDVIIHTQMREGVSVQVPAYLLYRSQRYDGARRLVRMAAHWTLKQSKVQTSGPGVRAWLPMTAIFARMLRKMGPAWVWAYTASVWRGVGSHGVRAVRELARAVSAQDAAALRSLFVRAGAELRFGDVQTTSDALLSLFPPGSQLSIEAPIAAGWVTACRFRVEGPAPARGLALFETAPDEMRLRQARFFTTPAHVSSPAGV